MKHLLTFIAAIITLASCSEQEPLKTFSLEEVRLTNSPFLNAQKIDEQYLLELDADRLLAPYIKEAGLEPKKLNYTNWENTGLDGHIGGHYLSALSMMYASTGDTVFLNKVNSYVEELKKCQDASGGGYLSGVPGGKQIWKEISEGKIEAGSFSLNRKWVPLYNIHKIYAGLRDAYTYAHNQDALVMLTKLSDWFLDITKNLNDDQLQKLLISEHGGMNEVFVDVAELTGDKKYLTFARRFSDFSVLNPLIDKSINLVGMHANTQIPKVIGYKRYADVAMDTAWNSASKYFWDVVVNDMTISIGGNSVREHFHSPDDFTSMVESEQGPETCNTYNMLKLSKMLFLSEGDQKYMDYYERAMYNHILSSQHPEKGGFVYFTPMRPQHYRVYSKVHTSFWCCVGSGLENHTKYAELIYGHRGDDIYTNLFIPSTLNWEEKGIVLSQETKFPYSNKVDFKIQEAKQNFKFNVRIPAWLKGKKPLVKINDKEVSVNAENGYAAIGSLAKGDRVSIELPMDFTIEYLPDGSNYASVAYGPIVLGAVTDTLGLDGLFSDDSRMGHVAKGEFRPLESAPCVISDEKDFSSQIEPIEGEPLHFNIKVDGDRVFKLQPFYEIHEARYMVYWPVYSASELEAKREEIRLKEEAILNLEKRTIDKVAPGEQQPESDHFFKGERTNSGVYKEHFWRDATGWFSYMLTDKKKEANVLRITYTKGDAGRKFRIEMNGHLLAKVLLTSDHKEEFYTIDYPLDEIKEKLNTKKIELKFIAEDGSVAGGIYGVRLLK